MEALEPSDDLKKDFDAFVASLKEQRDLTSRSAKRPARATTPKIQKVGTEAQKAQADYQQLSAKIGFKQCGGGS